MICAFRWWASRIEAETAPVQHVCNKPKDHPPSWHVCICGAKVEQ